MFIFVSLYVISASVNKVLLEKSGHTRPFAIHTEGCVIPNFPLVGEDINDLVGLPKRNIECSKSFQLLNSNQSHVWVKEEAIAHHSIGQFTNDFYCCYTNFSANEFLEDVHYGNCIQFSEVIKAEHVFVRIECYYSDNKVHDEFFVFPKVGLPVERKNPTKFNVLMFGIESVSRMNFLRTMPKTAKFLYDRGSVQLLGYNKLGDNSFPNLFPLLTGRSFKNILNDCIHKTIPDNLNVCTYIWDKFKSEGYTTALASDSPAGLLGSYEYSFSKIPTDYYLQPFMYETRNLFKNQQYYYHMCAGNKFYYKILLNYVNDLSEALEKNNLFGIFWEESISHEHLNYPHVMDADYADILLKLENRGYLNESVLVVFSDHGMRWGKIVQTDQGRMEERLPLMEILFPEKFKTLYRIAYRNFKENGGRLTTPYDIHETLIDLLNPTLLNDRNILRRSTQQLYANKSSLFLPVSDNRTCASIGIGEHWCTCHKGKTLRAHRKNRKLAADYLIAYINSMLHGFSQCQQLIVENILDVSMIKDSQGSTFKVVIQASPGGAIFYGTLRRERDLWAVSDTVSRLNLYRGQSNCVRDDQVKMYCYCK